MDSVFNRAAWRQTCEFLAQRANRSCGLVYEVYERELTSAINHELGNLAEVHRPEAIQVARSYGWATDEELAQSRRLMEEDGSCIHGIDPHWCPAGCGDIE
jgi:hypothetical protein